MYEEGKIYIYIVPLLTKKAHPPIRSGAGNRFLWAASACCSLPRLPYPYPPTPPCPTPIIIMCMCMIMVIVLACTQQKDINYVGCWTWCAGDAGQWW